MKIRKKIQKFNVYPWFYLDFVSWEILYFMLKKTVVSTHKQYLIIAYPKEILISQLLGGVLYRIFHIYIEDKGFVTDQP